MLFALCFQSPSLPVTDDSERILFLDRRGFIAGSAVTLEGTHERFGWFRHRATGYEGFWSPKTDRAGALVSLSIFQKYPRAVSRDVLRNGLTESQKESLNYCTASLDGRVSIYAGEMGERDLPAQVMDWDRAIALARSFSRVSGGGSRVMTLAERRGKFAEDSPAPTLRVTSLTVEEVRAVAQRERWAPAELIRNGISTSLFQIGSSPTLVITAWDKALDQVFTPGVERRFRKESRRVGVTVHLDAHYEGYIARELAGWELQRAGSMLIATKWHSLVEGPTVNELGRRVKESMTEARDVWNATGSPK